MITEEQEKTAEEEFAQAFDELIENGPWKKSLFLESVKKRLEEVRDEYLVGVGLKESSAATGAEAAAQSTAGELALAEDELLIYVSLYNAAGGDDTVSWGKIISNMGSQIISRPIYAKEDELLKFIRTKPKPENEGYACVVIKQSQLMIAPGGALPKDALGHDLLVVKEGAIDDKDIIRFVHDGSAYTYDKAKLTYLERHEVSTQGAGSENK